jgi:hypothetical protein
LKGLNLIFARLGFVCKERERSLLFVGDNKGAYEALSPLIDEFMSRDSRLRIILSSADPDIRSWLHQHFPKVLVVPLPFTNRVSAELYLRQLKIRAVAFVESSALSASGPFIAKLEQLAIGVVTVSGRTIETLARPSAASIVSEMVVVIGDNFSRGALNKGISAMTKSGLADMLEIMLARDLKALRKPGTFANLFISPRWLWAVSWRVTRISSMDTLDLWLGSPTTILCLGNGPSSADPALLNVQHDILFRVNHSWLGKKFMEKPDVVFTGGRPTMRALDGVVFGLQNEEAEQRLIRTRAFNPFRSHSCFFNVNDVTDVLRKFDWGHLRPTNGASMVAAAIALKPEKLVVAGIDLFQHPEGSYPSESSVPNAYAPAHSRETELEFVMQLFAGFDGELVIVGDILRSAWENYKRGFPV